MRTSLFTPESPRPWAIMRIILGVTLLWDTANRWSYAVELYSVDGFLFPAFPNTSIHPHAFDAFTTVTLYSLFVVLLGMLVIGWHSRFCAFAVFGLLAWFSLLDSATTLTKYSAISLHLLLIMGFAKPGSVWSVDAWWRNRQQRGVPLSSAWPRLLIRFLVASIYLGAAMTKIRLPDFATGDLLEFSLLDDAYGGTRLGLWLATKPEFLIVASFATIVFELLFPFSVWIPALRRVMLCLGIGFHIILASTMYLEIFSPVMIAALCSFLKESDLQPIQRFFAKVLRPFSKPDDSNISTIKSKSPTKPTISFRKGVCFNTAIFSSVVIASVATLTFFQHRRDGYGALGNETPITFQEVSKENAYKMIDAYEPDYRDYFHRFEVGSRMGYRHVYGERHSFRPGQVVYVLARLLQPHPSWDLEWNWIAPKQSMETQPAIATYQRRLDASHSYASIGFQLDSEFPSGRYVIQVLASERLGAKEVIAEIPFELIKEPTQEVEP
ncbi:MAG: HTTM domain-containing protein [Planctomycetaceae bacterium]|nr:HTTM domain-containing protein [Planctomycetaceae bacterium]